MTAYFDYRFKFPLAGLAQALQAFVTLRQAGLIEGGDLPENMLGDPRDAAGHPSLTPAFAGRTGRAALSYTDPATGQVVNVPAEGDPGYWYVAIRSSTPPSDVPFDPSVYGLAMCDPTESAAVLGVWA